MVNIVRTLLIEVKWEIIEFISDYFDRDYEYGHDNYIIPREFFKQIVLEENLERLREYINNDQTIDYLWFFTE